MKANWLALTSDKEETGPVTSRYKHLEKGVLEQAAGIKSLQIPEGNEQVCSASHCVEPRRVGTFETLVKDYCETKKAQSISDQKSVQKRIMRKE